MKPREVTWKLEDHTKAKHEILRKYLQAWLPILAQGGFPHIVVIDGFAGPGIYDDGEDGSPIIALKAFLDQQGRIKARCHFHFVEKDEGRAEELDRRVCALFEERGGKPANLLVKIHGGKSFEEAHPEIVRDHVPRGAPTFALVDPFGWSGIPMTMIADLMNRASGEVLINFMFEEINRFLAHPDQEANFDALFGCGEWREGMSLSGARRHEFIRNLYARQLKAVAGATHVRHFEMRNKQSRTDYLLFFGTKSRKGLMKMKEAMWSVDQTGELTFSDATNPDQMILFDRNDTSRLEGELLRRFNGQQALVEQVETFVVEQTAFRETHYKSILKELEARDAIQVLGADPKRRKGTFPNGTLVSFR